MVESGRGETAYSCLLPLRLVERGVAPVVAPAFAAAFPAAGASALWLVALAEDDPLPALPALPALLAPLEPLEPLVAPAALDAAARTGIVRGRTASLLGSLISSTPCS